MKPPAPETRPHDDAGSVAERVCPVCAAPVMRIHRRAADRLLSLFVLVHRYRCLGFSCGWEGTLREQGCAATTITRATRVVSSPEPRLQAWRNALYARLWKKPP